MLRKKKKFRHSTTVITKSFAKNVMTRTMTKCSFSSGMRLEYVTEGGGKVVGDDIHTDVDIDDGGDDDNNDVIMHEVAFARCHR